MFVGLTSRVRENGREALLRRSQKTPKQSTSTTQHEKKHLLLVSLARQCFFAMQPKREAALFLLLLLFCSVVECGPSTLEVMATRGNKKGRGRHRKRRLRNEEATVCHSSSLVGGCAAEQLCRSPPLSPPSGFIFPTQSSDSLLVDTLTHTHRHTNTPAQTHTHNNNNIVK